MVKGRYSNVMRGAYWYTHCKNYFRWGYDPCKNKDCYSTCIVMCERNYEFKEPGFVLHYYGCNLNCRFCWAYGIRMKEYIVKTPEEVVTELICKLNALCEDPFIRKAKIKPIEINTIRLTGNEPTLQWNHMMEFLRILNDKDRILELSENLSSIPLLTRQSFSDIIHRLKVLIQTNGIEIGRENSLINVDELRTIHNIHVYFEVSFKGVNPEQFAWLADSPPKLFEYQCAGFERLWRIHSNNIHVIAELGINHCNNVKNHPDLGVRIIDENGKPLDFTKSEYSQSFKEKVLKYTKLNQEANEFQEFGEINKDRARCVIETYSKITGVVKKRCLPSEFKNK